LIKPTYDELGRVLEQLQPDFVYLQGQQLDDRGEIGSLVWEDFDLSTPEALCGLFSSKLPNTVSVLWIILSYDCLTWII
jgi:hypothetical protein